jgi:hypothetical protein
MTHLDVIEYLDTVLSDQVVVDDLIKILSDPSVNWKIFLDEDKEGVISLPNDVPFEITTKCVLKEYYDVGFGSSLRVTVAVGGVSSFGHGVIAAKYFFATMYYTIDSKLITLDYHKEMR